MATEDLVQFALTFLQNAWHIWLEAAPWLLVGLVVAGILKLWVPTQLLQRWLGGRGFLPVLKAAVIDDCWTRIGVRLGLGWHRATAEYRDRNRQ